MNDQYLNQPLQLNHRIMNQTIQYGPNNNYPTNQMTSFTPQNYHTIGQNPNSSIDNYAGGGYPQQFNYFP